jgi:hypothetical protein
MSIQAPMPMSHHQSVAQFPSWVLPCSLRGWSLTGQPSPRSVQQNHVAIAAVYGRTLITCPSWAGRSTPDDAGHDRGPGRVGLPGLPQQEPALTSAHRLLAHCADPAVR